MSKINLKEIFNNLNKKINNKISCDKLYIVPAMRHWIDSTDEKTPTVLTSVLELGDKPYSIKKILINPDLNNDEITKILIKYLSHTLTLGDNWDNYINNKNILTE